MTPLIPAGIAAAALLYALLHKSAAPEQPAPIAPPDAPPAPPSPAPPTPVAPDVIPANLAAGTVNAQSGLNLRSAPDETSATVGAGLPYNSWVGLLETQTTAPTPAAPAGWFHVVTTDGRTGYVSAEWILFGTAKERGMTPAEEADYHRTHADRPLPDYQPVETAGIGARRNPYAAVHPNARAAASRARMRALSLGYGTNIGAPFTSRPGGAAAAMAPSAPLSTPSTFQHRPGGGFHSWPGGGGGWPWYQPSFDYTTYYLLQNQNAIARCTLFGGCPLQARPEADAPTFATLPQGANVNILQRLPGWAFVRWYGPKGAQYGWMPSGAFA